jgi:uncharacterized protein
MIEAVFDTNTLLQAAASKTGPANACWNYAEKRKIRIFVTEATLAELENVLNRPKVRHKFPHFTVENVKDVMNAFRTYCSTVAEPSARFQLDRDKDDAKFIDLAVATNANYIVTRDRDLLDLISDPEFTSEFQGLNIVTPVGFLEILRTA